MPTTSKTGPGRSHREGISVIKLFQMFPDDATAEAWFTKIRWPNGQIACHHCGSFNVQVGCAHKSMPFRCREGDCGKRFSVRSGTVMQSSKLGYRVWALATYMVLTNLKGVSSMKLYRELDIPQKTAWHLAHRIRAALTDDSPVRFAGPVEADETFCGQKAKTMHAPEETEEADRPRRRQQDHDRRRQGPGDRQDSRLSHVPRQPAAEDVRPVAHRRRRRRLHGRGQRVPQLGEP
jgi:transposase-like protein